MDKSKLIQPDIVDENTPFLFVSYSRKDIEEVQEVLRILRHNRFRFWYDMGLQSGAEWAEALGEKIEQCAQFMVIITENSMKSKYVRKEINMAVDTKNDGQILVLYLQNLVLPNGLRFLLGNLQAVLRSEYSDDKDFEDAICRAISSDLLYLDSKDNDDFIERSKRTVNPERVYKEDQIKESSAEDLLAIHYIIDQKIGKGGLSEVYLGHHRRTGMPVTIKRGVLDETCGGKMTYEAFKNELYLLTNKLRNVGQNIPTVVDWFEDDRNVFLVLSFINGVSLRDIEKEYTESEVVSILRKLLEILCNIHRRGIIYKDIKPGNILEDEYGTLFLIDFNVARDIEIQSENEIRGVTYGYSPPEQFSMFTGKNVHTDFSSDLYALGRTIENLLLNERFDRYRSRIPLRLYRKDISVEFENIIAKMTEPDRKERFQSAEEVLVALDNYQKIGFTQKVKLHYVSSRRIRTYLSESQRVDIKRKNDMLELADIPEFSASFLEEFKDNGDHTRLL